MMALTLRPYQKRAVNKSIEQLRSVRSTLVVMPTGTGKTIVFVSLAGIARGRVLMLAHRDELVSQARNSVIKIHGVDTGIEQAEQRSSGEKIVVGSVQTLKVNRLSNFDPNAFSIIVIDEAHHSTAQSYRAIINHFSGAKIIGVTATPDRTDRKPLGSVYESVAYEYGMIEAISDGWLVEPIAEQVVLQSVRLDDVRTSGGDLNKTQLEEKIGETKALHSIAKPLIDLSGDRKTVVYTPGVLSANRLAAILCDERPGCAHAIDGTTPIDERRKILSLFEKGEFQYIVNCQILTEGWDSPGVSCVAIARPTKSRSLYAQMLGRGLRLSEGKKDCLLIDYTDATRRHDLAGPEDALGGDLGSEVVEKAKRDRKNGEVEHIFENLIKAKSKVKYKTRRESLVAAQKRSAKEGNGRKVVPVEIAWTLFGFDPRDIEVATRWGLKPATEMQIKNLLKAGIDPGEITYDIAKRMISVVKKRRDLRLASPAQLKLISRYGKTNPQMTAEQATLAIERIAANNWRRM